MLSRVASHLYFESKTGTISRSNWWHILSLRVVQFSFEELSERGRRVLGFACVTEEKSLSEIPTWICHLESSPDSLFCVPSTWETGLNDAPTHGGTGRSLTLSRLCALHLCLAFCALTAGLNADRWTDKNKTKQKVSLSDAWGFALIRQCLGSCMWSLMQLAVLGDLSRVCLDVQYLCLWVAAVWMMERRQALVPLLLVFTLGASSYGKFKIWFCVDVAHKTISPL